MIDNRLLQVMLIASCVLLLVAIAVTVADITRYGDTSGPAARPAPVATPPAAAADQQ